MNLTDEQKAALLAALQAEPKKDEPKAEPVKETPKVVDFKDTDEYKALQTSIDNLKKENLELKQSIDEKPKTNAQSLAELLGLEDKKD